MPRPEILSRDLLRWFRSDARDLPWRKTTDPYKIWLSEIILQQTRVAQGLPYYERYVATFPTVQDLAAASEDEVLKLWEGLGYYSRARNLHKAAQRVVEEYDGEMPKTAQWLQLLPGVGRYTACAIASIAFGEHVPVVDGNVKRVLSRLFNLDACIDTTEMEQELWNIAASLVPEEAPGDFNQAMMELGARICTPKKPNCESCPVLSQCNARKWGVENLRPVRKPKKKVPHKELVAAIIQKDDTYLILKRPTQGMLGGLWEFPTDEIQRGETHQEALCRGMKETLGVSVHPGGLITTVKHAYTHFKITLNVYRCTPEKGRLKAKKHDEFRWINAADFDHYTFPKANHKFLDLLREEPLELF